MKLTQAAFIALPVLVSSFGRDRRERDRPSVGGRLGDDLDVVAQACSVLNTQIQELVEATCDCSGEGKTGVKFECDLGNVTLDMESDKVFTGNFNLTGDFNVDVWGRQFNLGLGSCFDGSMNVTENQDLALNGCVSAELCPAEKGSDLDLEICDCTASLNSQDCTCSLCTGNETGVKFQCGTLPFPIDLCFPSVDLPF